MIQGRGARSAVRVHLRYTVLDARPMQLSLYCSYPFTGNVQLWLDIFCKSVDPLGKATFYARAQYIRYSVMHELCPHFGAIFRREKFQRPVVLLYKFVVVCLHVMHGELLVVYPNVN